MSNRSSIFTRTSPLEYSSAASSPIIVCTLHCFTEWKSPFFIPANFMFNEACSWTFRLKYSLDLPGFFFSSYTVVCEGQLLHLVAWSPELAVSSCRVSSTSVCVIQEVASFAWFEGKVLEYLNLNIFSINFFFLKKYKMVRSGRIWRWVG